MTLGVAVIGLGFMGRTHLASYSASGAACRITGVFDTDPARLTGRATGAGNIDTGSGEEGLFDPEAVFATDSLDDLLAREDIDAVSVCTPTDTHATIATAALRAGKHVLVEKPVTLSERELEAISAEATRSGRVCMPAMCMRFWPAWVWLADRVRDGRLGPLRSLALERIGSAPSWGGGFYQDDGRSGGAIFDLHIHDTDFVCGLLGLPEGVTSVGDRARLTTVYHYGVSGTPGHVTASGGWMRGGAAFRMRYLAEFEGGTADFDLTRDRPLLLGTGGEAAAVELPDGTGYDHEIVAFLRAASTGDAPPVTLADAMDTLRVLHAEARALESRRREIL
jgi:predicted dehydrogenase